MVNATRRDGQRHASRYSTPHVMFANAARRVEWAGMERLSFSSVFLGGNTCVVKKCLVTLRQITEHLSDI